MSASGVDKRYEIVQKIGSGGMSVVYLARDRKTNNNKVAIKVLTPSALQNPIAKKRFENEVKLHAQIDSPYVVKLLDYKLGDDNDRNRYLVMEYVEGRTLNDYISYRQSLTVDETVDFTKEILLGVSKMHELNIIHRDLKSSNIIITPDDKAKLIDLGIAQHNDSEHLTKTDNIIGSSEYIAPEISQGSPASIQTDYYAIGILMYQMLTGNVPFTGTTPGQILQKHISQSIPMVNKVAPNVPQALANVVAKALAKNPAQRYASFGDFYGDLKTCLSEKRMDEKPILLDKESHQFSLLDFVNSKAFLIVISLFGLAVICLSIILLVIFV